MPDGIEDDAAAVAEPVVSPEIPASDDLVSVDSPVEEPPAESIPEPDATPAPEAPGVDETVAAIERLTAQLAVSQDVIGRMQSRIEDLQRDQVRALLGPAVTELANLHAAFAEAADRDYERLGLPRVRKEFDLLGDRVLSALDLLGAESLDAAPGDVFDSRRHTAIRQVPTDDPALDQRIERVDRQGFTFDHEGRPALYARVTVHALQDAPAPVDDAPVAADAPPADADAPPVDALPVAASGDASPVVATGYDEPQ